METGEKQLLRNKARHLIREFPAEKRAEASSQLRGLLASIPRFVSAKCVYGFAPAAAEPDWIGGMLPEGKTFAFPRVEGRIVKFYVVDSLAEMHPSRFGVLEPEPLRPAPEPDLILVPGMAFDASGHRLGHGTGYYDRFLVQCKCYMLGLTFSCQILPFIPTQTHDIDMDGLLTESGLVLSHDDRVWHPQPTAVQVQPPKDRSSRGNT